MENTPVIYLAGYNWHFESPDKRERYFKWSEAVYVPFRMKNPGLLEYDRYEAVNKSPEYPDNLTLQHYTNENAYDFRLNSQPDSDVSRDMRTGWGTEWIWGGIYRQVKSTRRESAVAGKNPTGQILNAPFLHLEGLSLEAPEYDKYTQLWTSAGCSAFIPLLLETTKLMGWDLYERFRNPPDVYKVRNYPKYMSLIYFQNAADFTEFERSPALKALKTLEKQILSGDLVYRWYAEYRLWYLSRREA